MKKRLLFGALLMGSFLTANAQDTCDDALSVAVAGGTYTTPDIDGEYPTGDGVCGFAEGTPSTGGGQAEDYAVWYEYTPAENGLLTVDVGIAATAATIDTRLMILSGSCGDFTCVATSDDINYPADVRSRIAGLPVEAGVTYYIVFDNMWAGGVGTAPANDGGLGGFDFEVSFEAVSCFGVSTGFAYTGAPSPTSVMIGWDAPIGEPGSYDILWGEEDFDPEMEGTAINGVTETEVEINGLDASTNYDFYIQSNCAEGEESEWVGPIAFTTLDEPDTLPYENNLDDEANPVDGIFSMGWTFATNAQVDNNPATDYSQSGEGFAFTSTAAESWMYKGFDLEAGQTVEVSFFATYLDDETDDASLAITVGAEPWNEAENIVVETFTIPGGGEYEEFSTTYTAETAGVYYFGFHNLAGTTNGFSLLVDTISIEESTNGTNDVLASKFSVYPNPAANVINIANAENILVNGVVITDLNGRTVKNVSYDGVAEAQINVSDLAAGMYMMAVSSDKGTMTKKIVKN